MLEINSLAIDVEASENGKWFKFKGGAEFLIARHNNDKADQLRASLTLKHWDVLTGEDTEEADRVAREIAAKVVSETILKDWKGVGNNGEPLEYSSEIGLKYLSDPRMKDLLRFVENQAMSSANWQAKVEEEVTESVKATAAS